MQKRYTVVVMLVTIAATCGAQEIVPRGRTTSEDAFIAASESHEVLYEDEKIRLLSVTLLPKESTPMHHHAMPSVLIIDSYATLTELFEGGIEIAGGQIPTDAQIPFVMVRGPEAAHAVSNTDTKPLHLYRLEFKDLEFQNIRRSLEQVGNQTE